MLTVTCRGYRAVHKADGIVLEIEEPVPADLLPRLISKAEAARRFAVCQNHFVKLAKKHGIRPVADKPVRYRESDLVKLTLSAGERLSVVPAIVPMPTVKTKPVAIVPLSPATTTRAVPPPRKTKLHL